MSEEVTPPEDEPADEAGHVDGALQSGSVVTSEQIIRRTIERSLSPGCFFVAAPGILRGEYVEAETLRWEIYLGHLMAPAQARAEQTFESWRLLLDSPEALAPAPIIAVHRLIDASVIYVTRQILTHGFEAYEETPGVILTRPVEKWVAELVATIASGEENLASLAEELGTAVFSAVIGTSRLPITSLECPLPGYSLGQVGYLSYMPHHDEPFRNAAEFLEMALAGDRSHLELAKTLETALRALTAAQPPSSETIVDPTACIVEILKFQADLPDRGAAWVSRLMRDVFNGASLSPYTGFADALVKLALELSEQDWFGPAAGIDVLGYMLRHLCRHLTAFDLTIFHNSGANYPDALFLDELLKAYIRLIEAHPKLLIGDEPASASDSEATFRLRRRALRHGLLLRRQYEGHRVPDAPTSMGENTRVLPEPFRRVPDEQIFEMGKRKRKLFFEDPTDQLLCDAIRSVWEASLRDLDDPRELRELGLAHYLDRPLGILKQPGEIDRTPLLSYEAFSAAIVKRRLAAMKSYRWLTAERREALLAAIPSITPSGLPVAELNATQRPGVVSVLDAQKAAADFLLLRTTRGSLDGLLAGYDLTVLEVISPATHDWLLKGKNVLAVQSRAEIKPPRPVLRFYDGSTLRLELALTGSQNTQALYVERFGRELISNLQILRLEPNAGASPQPIADQPVFIVAK